MLTETMITLGVVFLGIIAMSAVVQAAFLIGLAREGKKLARRLDEMERRFENEVRPALQSFSRLSHNLADVSELLSAQARRVDIFMADTIDKLEETTGVLRQVMMKPVGTLMDITALLKGFRKGLDVYRRLGGLESQRKGGARRYPDDEHLFI
jgi:hypothetical protein